MRRYLRLMLIGTAILGCSDPASVDGPFDPQLPDWRIAFVSDRDGVPQIYVATAEGEQVTRLVMGQAPALSSDGRQLAFHRWPGVAGDVGGVYVVNADGSGLRRLAAGRNPAWSPDDSRIAFDDGTGIFVVAVDGSARQSILGSPADLPRPPWQNPDDFDPGWLERPTWSPDGQYIAFVRADPYTIQWGTERNVYVMNADGSDPHYLGGPCDLSPPAQGVFQCSTWDPAWAPDGERIAVITYAHDGTTGEFDPALAVVGPDGWAMRTVHYRGYKHHIGRPHWSPDGEQILFDQYASPSAEDDRRTRIFVLALATGDVRQVVSDAAGAATLSYGDWEPVRIW